MKNIVESAEVFEAYVRIDCNYFLLQKIQEESQVSDPKTPIEKMVDDASGFTAKRVREYYIGVIAIVENILKDKKFIEADTAETEKLLEKVNKAYQTAFPNDTQTHP